jgi:hypothetical protein
MHLFTVLRRSYFMCYLAFSGLLCALKAKAYNSGLLSELMEIASFWVKL